MFILISMLVLVLSLSINEIVGIVSSFMIFSLAMYYTKQPARPSWFKTNDDLIKLQSGEKVRSKLAEQIKAKKLETINPRLYVVKQIIDDRKDNAVLIDALLGVGPSFIYGPRGYRDVLLTAKINKSRSTYDVTAKSLDGEILSNSNPISRRINLDLHPGAMDVIVEFKWVVINKEGAIACVALYQSISAKLAESLEVFKWKK